jgi:RNA-directed DNA polymerase
MGRKGKLIKNEKRFNNINWKNSKTGVLKIQQEILIAYNKRDYLEIDKLQNKLVCSFGARALAVRKVISNRGFKTSGVDKKT